MKQRKARTILSILCIAAAFVMPFAAYADEIPEEEGVPVVVRAVSRTLTSFANGTFIWQDAPVPGAEFDVFLTDDREGVVKVTTDLAGLAETAPLPGAGYIVEETGKPDVRYGTADMPFVEAEAEGNETLFTYSVMPITITAAVINAPGAEISLTAEDDILSADGSLLVPEGTVISSIVSDGLGEAVFEDLPGAAFKGGDAGYMYSISVTSLPPDRTMEGIETVFLTGEKDERIELCAGLRTITVRYVSQEGDDLPGAVIAITRSDGEALDSFETDGSPYTTDQEIAPAEGDYYVEIVSPAEGYKPASSRVPFEIREDDFNVEVTVYADISKTWASVVDASDGAYIPGAELVVKDAYGEIVRELTSSDGPIDLKGLPDGYYTLEQVSAPEGYVKAGSVDFVMTDGESFVPPVIENLRVDGYIQIQLMSAADRSAVPGAEFTLYGPDGSVMEKIVTDGDGVANTSTFSVGTYKDGIFTGSLTYSIAQTGTPSGFIRDDGVYEVTLDYLDDETVLVAERIMIPVRVKVAAAPSPMAPMADGTGRGNGGSTGAGTVNTADETNAAPHLILFFLSGIGLALVAGKRAFYKMRGSHL